jgi:hypothetical protein
MELFELKDYKLTFSPQALSLKPFQVLWKRDKSTNKKTALSELSFIYYYSDHKSDFFDIVNEEERRLEIIKYLDLPDNWIPDDKVLEAVEFYKTRSETIGSKLLRNIVIGVNNIGEMFKDIDVNAMDERGKPVYNIAQLVTAAKSIPALITALKEAQEEVNKELKSKSIARGSIEKSIFEDGI